MKLPAAVFDGIADLAAIHGGIGCRQYLSNDAPCCLVGFVHAYNLDVRAGRRQGSPCYVSDLDDEIDSRTPLALEHRNDLVVRTWQQEHPDQDRMPWADYVAAFPIEREDG